MTRLQLDKHCMETKFTGYVTNGFVTITKNIKKSAPKSRKGLLAYVKETTLSVWAKYEYIIQL